MDIDINDVLNEPIERKIVSENFLIRTKDTANLTTLNTNFSVRYTLPATINITKVELVQATIPYLYNSNFGANTLGPQACFIKINNIDHNIRSSILTNFNFYVPTLNATNSSDTRLTFNNINSFDNKFELNKSVMLNYLEISIYDDSGNLWAYAGSYPDWTIILKITYFK